MNGYEEIPEVVWRLLDEIVWRDAGFDAPPKLLTGDERFAALTIAWGWTPPLVKPGDRRQLTFEGLAALSWRRLKETEPAKRKGRPKADQEGRNDALVLAALSKHHRYQDGIAANDQPASYTDLVEFGLNKTAVSRFLERKLGKRPYKAYERACQQRMIGHYLAVWRGEMPKRELDLRDDE
jgi:hypothetical protein